MKPLACALLLLVGCGKTYTETELCKLAEAHQLDCDVIHFSFGQQPWMVNCRSQAYVHGTGASVTYFGHGFSRKGAISEAAEKIDHNQPYNPDPEEEPRERICPKVQP
jgi:hypothetical protein